MPICFYAYDSRFAGPAIPRVEGSGGATWDITKNVIQTAVEAEIRKTQSKAARRIKFPLLPSREPGTLNLTNADIEDLLA